MKILHITASYKPAYVYGGPIYSVGALCEELCRDFDSAQSDIGFDSPFDSAQEDMAQPDRVEVYTTLANGKEELPYQNGESKIVDGVKVTYFKRLTKDHSHFSPSLLSHLWRNAKEFDIIHIHSWWNLVSMGAVIVCLCRGIKLIISPRGMLGDYTLSKPKAIFHQLIGKYLLRKCNFHATTTMEAEEIAKQVFDGKVEVVDLMKTRYESQGARQKKDDNKIFIIHNSVKLPEDLPVKTRVFDGSLKLIFLSRIHHKKGIELMLDALALVNFPFKLSIVGEGEPDYVESLKSKAESLKLNEKINWVGAVYGEEKYQLLANHDAFILPSYNENFANVVIEAIAVGTPVLLSDKVGLKDYVREHDFGLIFKLDELEASLKKAYSLFTENKLHFNNVLSVIREPLTAKYIEMYDIV